MFTLAILIGIYSYIIFFLGLSNLLYKQIIYLVSIAYLLIVAFYLKKNVSIYNFRCRVASFIRELPKLGLLLLAIIILQIIINLTGALGPELGFDALWYHLTLPKIYLINHLVSYIPGGLLYYSAMPKLTEMLYVSGLALGSEIFPKLIHFSFGILCLIALYKLSRKFLTKNYSLLALVLFYSNLVVGWMSITAYVDLSRTFFEIMALWGFVNWIGKKEKKWFIMSAFLLGLAISTKLLALGSLLILTILILIFTRKISYILIYCFCALMIPLPWFAFSYLYTGSPVFPFFTKIYSVNPNFSLINPLSLSDPISPLYIIFLPVALFIYRKLKPNLKIVDLYSFLAVIVWYLTPQTGGGRFILAYLPASSLITVVVISMVKQKALHNVFIGLVIVLASFSVVYRGAANFKYVPVVFGQESKSQFLTNHLNFSFGDFYDVDGYFAKKIKETDKVLLYGFHNLYYVNFPFIDSSFLKKGDRFNYIAVYGDNLPSRFKFWNLIYFNTKTNVRLYSIGGMKWIY